MDVLVSGWIPGQELDACLKRFAAPVSCTATDVPLSDLVQMIREHPPDLMIVAEYPDHLHPDGLARLCRAGARRPVVVFRGSEDPRDVLAAHAAGVAGYMTEAMSPKVRACVLQLVMSGERFLPASVLGVAVPVGQEPRLTPRENEILLHVGRGQSNKEIARDLGLKEITVKVHLKKIFRKLGVTNRTQAARRLMWPGSQDDAPRSAV